MSDRTRMAIGGAETLAQTIVQETAPRPEFGARRLELCFSRVLESGSRLIISAQPREAARFSSDEATTLVPLQGRMLRHYFRLQIVERKLSTRTRPRRTGVGKQAVRQIERERQRLGRELHTGVGQMLAAIRLQLEIIASQVPDPPETVRQALDRIGVLASEALDQVRSVSRRLHPPEWQRLTTATAISQLCEVSGISQRFRAVLRLEELPREPEPEIKVFFYRAAQEALANLSRHAHATEVEVNLTHTTSRVELQVRDNGVGFDTGTVLSSVMGATAGLGLRSIREQAKTLGGAMTVESGPGGTSLKVSAPYSVTDK